MKAAGIVHERFPGSISRADRQGSNELLDEIVTRKAVYAG